MIIYCLLGKEDCFIAADSNYEKLLKWAKDNNYCTNPYFIVELDTKTEDCSETILLSLFD